MKLKHIKLFELDDIISPKSLGLLYKTGNIDWSLKDLTSLEGSPSKINGDFDISFNNLTSLEYSPNVITGNYNCDMNNLDFFNIPKIKVGGNFYYSNLLTKNKNINKLLKNLDLGGKFVSTGSILGGELLTPLFIRKATGADLDELLVEGMIWCSDHNIPEDFWGDIE